MEFDPILIWESLMAVSLLSLLPMPYHSISFGLIYRKKPIPVTQNPLMALTMVYVYSPCYC